MSKKMEDKQILVVDDEVISLTAITEYLESAGYSVNQAVDGKGAWDMLLKSPTNFCLVITDRIMPKKDGLDLLSHMQSHDFLKTVPVIMLTGVLEKKAMVDATRFGVFDFLIKPVEQQLLLHVVRRALQRFNGTV